MVLGPSSWRRIALLPLLATLALGAGLLSSGCVKRAPLVVLAEPAPMQVAFVHDSENESSVSGLPEGMETAVTTLLSARGLRPSQVEAGLVSERFARLRTTGQRLQWMSDGADSGELLLLVETRANYVSQMAGRWRWLVSVRLSVLRAGSVDGVDASLELPVFLSRAAEGSVEALEQALPGILRRLGGLLDDALAELTTTEGPSAEGADLQTRVAPGLRVADSGPAGGAQSGFIYFVMVDRFADGSPNESGSVDKSSATAFHGGDIRGIINKLDYLEELGATSLWLTPVTAMRSADFGDVGAFHGYWLEDPYSVEPRFGSLEDLQELASGLRSRGMGLYLDVVNNHVAYDSELVTTHPEWFHGKGDIVDWSDPVQVETHDVHGLPDLDQSHPEVRDWLMKAGLHWVSKVRPQGFRIDALRHVPTSFWRDYGQQMKEAGGEGFELLGEHFEGAVQPLASAWVEGGFTGMFDFPLYYAMTDVFCRGAHPGKIAAILGADRLYPDATKLVTFIDNHDLPRAVSACSGDAEAVEQMLRLVFAVRGTPALTWGTELPLEGAAEPGNRASMDWGREGKFTTLIRDLATADRPESGGRVLSLDETGFVYLRPDGAELELKEGKITLRESSDRTAVEAQSSGGQAGGVRFEALEGAVGDIVVVGGAPELGAWDPARGLPLGEVVQLPEGQVYDYKLARRGEEGVEVEWEPRGNRYLFVPESGSVELSLSWGS